MGQSASTTRNEPPSTLEGLLCAGKWDDVRSFLQCPDGRVEVNSELVSYHGRSKLKTPALYAALFHRAPLDVVETIHGMKPEGLSDEDLHCALEHGTDILTTGEARRRWNRNEHQAIIEFIVEKCRHSTASVYAKLASVSTPKKKYTPLGFAVDNPDVSARIVALLCSKCPDAMAKECEYDGHAIFPLSLSVGQPEKMNMLVRGPQFFAQSSEVTNWEKVSLPPLDASMFDAALASAAEQEDWKLTQELLPGAESSGMAQDRLAFHRNRMDQNLARERANGESDARMHRNLGLIMYDVDILTDLVSPIIPKKFRKKKRERALREARILG